MSAPWTQEEDDFLRQNNRKMSQRKIGASLGRSPGAVKGRIYRLGITKERRWTNAEDTLVCKFYKEAGSGKLDLAALAAKLERSRSDVCNRARGLGLTNSKRMKTKNGPRDRRKFNGDTEALLEHISQTTKERIASQGHPRGMAGKKHSVETKERLSKISADRWRSMNAEQQQAQLDKGYAARKQNGFSPPKGGRGSWAAGWRQVGERRIYFRSRWEANYAFYLQWLKENGQIASWEYEPKTFWFEQIKRGVRSYKPDFHVIENNGSGAYHEVKGWMDSRSRTTLSRMRKYYPQEKLILIDAKAYRAIRRKALGLVPGWEDSARDART